MILKEYMSFIIFKYKRGLTIYAWEIMRGGVLGRKHDGRKNLLREIAQLSNEIFYIPAMRLNLLLICIHISNQTNI